MKILKINIDKNAEKALYNMIEKSEYDCLAIKPSQNCIKNLELIIDHKKNYKTCELIGKNTICFDDEIQNLVEEVFLKYEENNFLLKIVPVKIKDCSCKSCYKDK